MLTIIGVCANGAVTIIVLILVLILAWNYLKLLFEAAERYVLLGVLVYTAPVAFAMGASQATSNIFKSWCRMFGGQIFLLLMNGIIYTRDHRYVKVVEVVPVNFLLRSAQEQRSIIYSFISYLKIAPVKVQFKVLTKRADIDRHVESVRRELARESDPRCRALQEDYLQLIRQLGSREAITRRFFLVFEHEEMPGTRKGHEEEEAIASLQTAARTTANYLRQCGNTVLLPESEDEATCEVLYNILCRKESKALLHAG